MDGLSSVQIRPPIAIIKKNPNSQVRADLILVYCNRYQKVVSDISGFRRGTKREAGSQGELGTKKWVTASHREHTLLRGRHL